MLRRLVTAAVFIATASVGVALSSSVSSTEPTADVGRSSSWIAMAFPVPPATPAVHAAGGDR